MRTKDLAPSWLTDAVMNDRLDWSKALPSSFPLLLERVNLHDANWIAIHANIWQENILVIELDAHWNKEYIGSQHLESGSPFLIINIPNTLQIQFHSTDPTTIGMAVSNPVDKQVLQHLLPTQSGSTLFPPEYMAKIRKTPALHHTSIYDVYGGGISILHEPEIRILLIDRTGKYLDPSIEKPLLVQKQPAIYAEEKGLFKKLIDLFKSNK